MDGSSRPTTLLFAGPWWGEYFLGLQKKHDHVWDLALHIHLTFQLRMPTSAAPNPFLPQCSAKAVPVCLPYLLKAQPLDSCARNISCLQVPLSGAKPKPQDRTLPSIDLPRAVSIFHGGPRLSSFLLAQMSQVLLFSEDGYFLLLALFRLLQCN